MKIKGQKLEPPKPVVVVLPRGSDDHSDDLVFHCAAVLDYEPFEKLCKMPVPPKKTYAGGKTVDDHENPTFIKNVEDHFTTRYNWMVITSLKSTPDLQWETVDFQNSDTWGNFEKELREVMTNAEVNEIKVGVMTANSMNAERMAQARDFFQRSTSAKE